MAVSRTGRLNHRLTFYSNERKKDMQSGQSKDNFVKQFECWFDYKQKFASELAGEVGTVFESAFNIVVRQNLDTKIKNDWLIDINGTKYEIVDKNPDVSHDGNIDGFLVIVCKRSD
ncbi:phage head closure protein [Listeria seeligeri]|uniref:phage head closure protein n=1 Tax=Listeria seeligeri TaxID=1640 RepID=UPI00188930C9|nr:phage head closure protein [Listeria seeligeri]MBF2653961.1 phage head closure protein [Listeria seeligeri]